MKTDSGDLFKFPEFLGSTTYVTTPWGLRSLIITKVVGNILNERQFNGSQNLAGVANPSEEFNQQNSFKTKQLPSSNFVLELAFCSP
jgi:hypothetical protein